jgi:hypothetical protein
MVQRNGDQWFYASPDGNKGPFSSAQMLELHSKGVLTPHSMIWKDGLANWIPLEKSILKLAPSAASPNAPAAYIPAAPGGGTNQAPKQSQDDYLDSVFVQQVKDSWKRFHKRQVSTQVDEVLVGAVITSTLDNGFALIDLESSQADHMLRFEQLSSGVRIIFRLSHHAESILTSSVLGHEASVSIGYGERIQDFNRVWTAIKQEMKGGYVRQADPGIITIDGDMSSQYVYVEVGLLWDLNDFLDPDNPYQVNYAKLTLQIGATIHALRKYLRGRFGN